MRIKMLFFNIYLILLSMSGSCEAQKSLFTGSIQFPNTLLEIPPVRIYYAGQKVASQTDEGMAKILYTIFEHKERGFFYILIANDIEFGSLENTVPFLRVKKNAPYKFYAIQRVAKEVIKSKNMLAKETGIEYSWIAHELNLSSVQNRIPDETIIVCYNSEYIQAIEGGNFIEFPKIIIKPDILKLVGSEEKLHALSRRWFLAALNTDAIHSSPESEIVIPFAPKTILSMASAA